MADFASLGLSPWLVQTLRSLGLSSPTPIQVQSVPPILQGRDVVGKAKTGSGKTAAFALPILQTLAKDPYGIYCVVLTPTRELAFQLAEQFRVLGASLPLKDAVVVGGLDMLSQGQALAERPHVIIATPGRLADHIRSGARLHLTHCRFLVLDEVDRLLEPKFRKDLQSIVEQLPPPHKRQTLLFSATMTKEEVLEQREQFGLRADNTDFCCVVSDDDALVESLDQKYLFMPQHIKEAYLVYLLRESHFAGQSAIVFVATCRGCEVVAQLLAEVGVQCESLHSRKSQQRRLASLGKFRSGLAKVLVATDVASRGLDIPTVQLVLNYDLPRVSADYIHRVGRTARAGRGGAAVSFVSQYDIEVFKALEDGVAGGKKMDLFPLKEEDVLELLKEVNNAKRMAKIRLEDFERTSKVVRRRKRDEDDDDEGEEGGDGKEEQRGEKPAQKAKPAAAAAAASSSSAKPSTASLKKKTAPSPAAAAASSSSSSKQPLKKKQKQKQADD